MSILVRAEVADLLARNDLLDPDQFSDGYVAGVISAVQGSIQSYLHWNPCLSVYTNEEGSAQLVQSGPYAGRYFLELHNQPLVPGEASAIFSKLQLKYALTTPTGADVALDFVKVLHPTGQVFCLAPGASEALSGAMFGTAPAMQRITAIQYSASYSSGFAVGNGTDPTNPITHSAFTGIPPLPANIRDAAVLLVRERLMYDSALNKNPSNPNAGLLYRVRVGEREEAYRSFSRATVQGTLGLGTPLAESAEMLLRSSVKRQLPLFL